MKFFNSAKEIGDDTVLRRNPDMLFNEIDGEVVMLSIENGEYYGLDKVGSRIWELLEKPLPFNYILSVLLNEYEVSIDQCRIDTLSFINTMIERDLLLINN